MELSAKVRTCLWFDGNGEEAAQFYVSLLPDSLIENVVHPKPDQPPLVVEFKLAGAPMMILNGGPQFTHSEAASISVLTKDQAETDRLWDALTAGGGTQSMCGWLKDRYVSADSLIIFDRFKVVRVVKNDIMLKVMECRR